MNTVKNWLKIRLICSWWHGKYKCYPEVWGRALKGPWHCEKCHPCNEEFYLLYHLPLHPGKENLERYYRGCYVGKFLPIPAGSGARHPSLEK